MASTATANPITATVDSVSINNETDPTSPLITTVTSTTTDMLPSNTKKENNALVEIMSGMLVALATLPTSISYALLVGITPALGIWNSAILGLVSSMVGGAPGKDRIVSYCFL